MDTSRTTPSFIFPDFGSLWQDTSLVPSSMQGPIHQDIIFCGQLNPFLSGLCSLSALDADDYSIDRLCDSHPAVSEAAPSYDEIYTIQELMASCFPSTPSPQSISSTAKCLSRSVPTFDAHGVQALAGNGVLSAYMAINAEAQNLTDVGGVQRKDGPSSKMSADRGVPKHGKDHLPAFGRLKSKSDVLCGKRTRMTPHFDKAQNILRERWRRDDMAGKFLILESLLPPSGSKRDRSTIVDEAVKLVKSLQHRKEVLLRKHSQMEQAVVAAWQSPQVKVKRSIQQVASPDIKHSQRNGIVSTSFFPMNLPTSNIQECRQVEPTGNMSGSMDLKTCVKSLWIHSEQPHGESITIEMISQPMPNFQSIFLKTLEHFDLEVTSCDISRTIHTLICSTTVKPRPLPVHMRRPIASITESLRSALEPL